MKKILSALCVLVLCIVSLFSFSGCADSTNYWSETYIKLRDKLFQNAQYSAVLRLDGNELSYGNSTISKEVKNSSNAEYYELTSCYDKLMNLATSITTNYYLVFDTTPTNEQTKEAKSACSELIKQTDVFTKALDTFNLAKNEYEEYTIGNIVQSNEINSEADLFRLAIYKKAYAELIYAATNFNHYFVNAFTLNYCTDIKDITAETFTDNSQANNNLLVYKMQYSERLLTNAINLYLKTTDGLINKDAIKSYSNLLSTLSNVVTKTINSVDTTKISLFANYFSAFENSCDDANNYLTSYKLATDTEKNPANEAEAFEQLSYYETVSYLTTSIENSYNIYSSLCNLA